MLKKQNLDSNIHYKQESVSKVILRQINNANIWHNLFFSNIVQLLPMWIMYLIQAVSKYQFDVLNYISNLLVFVIISCVTVFYDLFGKKSCKMSGFSKVFIIFLLFSLSCFASVLYCLVLLYDKTEIAIDMTTMHICSYIFTLIVAIMSFWKA